MDGTTAVFGVGCGLTVALAYCAKPKDREDAFTLAIVLVGVWFSGAAAYKSGDLGGMAYIDLSVALLAAILCLIRMPMWELSAASWLKILITFDPHDWRRVFFQLCAVQIGVNLAYGIWGNAVYDAYYWLINGSGALQLAVIGNRGVADAWHNLCDCIRRPSSLFRA